MLTINSFVLYVEDIQVSQAFYSKLFDCEVTFLSPTFASMPLANGLKLTLKQSDVLSPSSAHLVPSVNLTVTLYIIVILYLWLVQATIMLPTLLVSVYH